MTLKLNALGDVFYWGTKLVLKEKAKDRRVRDDLNYWFLNLGFSDLQKTEKKKIDDKLAVA